MGCQNKSCLLKEKKMVRTNLSLFDNFNQLTPYTVGFDRVFDQLQNYVENNSTSTGYPPYNIRKDGEYNYNIEMALAGFSKKDIEVEVADGVLTIRSVKENEEDENNADNLKNSTHVNGVINDAEKFSEQEKIIVEIYKFVLERVSSFIKLIGGKSRSVEKLKEMMVNDAEGTEEITDAGWAGVAYKKGAYNACEDMFIWLAYFLRKEYEIKQKMGSLEINNILQKYTTIKDNLSGGRKRRTRRRKKKKSKKSVKSKRRRRRRTKRRKTAKKSRRRRRK